MRTLLAVSVALTLLVSLDANAYSIAHKCRGSPATWYERQNYYAKQPNFAGYKVNIVQSAIRSWNSVPGAREMLRFGGTTGTWTVKNGKNEVSSMPAKYIDGNPGGAFMNYTACNWFRKSRITEVDIAVATDMDLDWIAPAEHTTSIDNVWSIMVHEFGHALGLGHGSRFSVMSTASTWPVHGGDPLLGTSGPHYDDASGARFLYYSGNAPTNLYASTQMMEQGHLVNNNAVLFGLGDRDVCPGDQINLYITVGNNGSRDVHADEVIFLQHENLPSIPVKALRGRQFDRGQTYLAQGVTFTVPLGIALLGSSFRVYHLVDSCAAHDETREDDNLVWTGITLHVKETCP